MSQTRAQELPEISLLARIAHLEDQIEQLRTPQSIGAGGSGNGNGIITVANASGVTTVQEDVSGLHVYNTSAQEMVRADSAGFHTYTTAGVEIVRADSTSLQLFDPSGNLKVRLDQTGSTYIGSSGNAGIVIYRNQTDYNAAAPSGSIFGFTQGANKSLTILANDWMNLTAATLIRFSNSTGMGSTLADVKSDALYIYSGVMPTSVPGAPVNGSWYYDPTNNTLWIYNGAWRAH